MTHLNIIIVIILISLIMIFALVFIKLDNKMFGGSVAKQILDAMTLIGIIDKNDIRTYFHKINSEDFNENYMTNCTLSSDVLDSNTLSDDELKYLGGMFGKNKIVNKLPWWLFDDDGNVITITSNINIMVNKHTAHVMNTIPIIDNNNYYLHFLKIHDSNHPNLNNHSVLIYRYKY